MKFYQRVANVIARKGFVGAWNAALGKLFKTGPYSRMDVREAREEYERLVKEFKEKTADIDFPGLDRFLWYHTIELGDGLVTPGNYDYREVVDAFHFPEDMSGMNVLDIGSATGFFSFEFVKRGATVTSVELPTIAGWDTLSGEEDEILKALTQFHRADSVEEAHYLHLDGPFLFCRELLGLNVNRCYSSIYDLCPEKVNHQRFDLVFIGDVLLHIFSPLKALNSVAPLCRGKLIVSQTIPDVMEGLPLAVYVGGDNRSDCEFCWWLPNRACFTQLLKRLGFRTVEFVSEYRTIERPSYNCSTRTIVHATR